MTSFNGHLSQMDACKTPEEFELHTLCKEKRPARHYEIWVYCQSTSRVQAQGLQNLRVQRSGPVEAALPTAAAPIKLMKSMIH